MIHLDATLFHHLFQLAIADRILHVPAHSPQNNALLKLTAFEIDHIVMLLVYHCSRA